MQQHDDQLTDQGVYQRKPATSKNASLLALDAAKLTTKREALSGGVPTKQSSQFPFASSVTTSLDFTSAPPAERFALAVEIMRHQSDCLLLLGRPQLLSAPCSHSLSLKLCPLLRAVHHRPRWDDILQRWRRQQIADFERLCAYSNCLLRFNAFSSAPGYSVQVSSPMILRTLLLSLWNYSKRILSEQLSLRKMLVNFRLALCVFLITFQ